MSTSFPILKLNAISKDMNHTELSAEEKAILLKQHNAKEKIAMTFLQETSEEIRHVFNALKKVGSSVPRAQLVLCFTLVDVVANYWDHYGDKNNGWEEKFNVWIETFCFVKKNPIFENNPSLQKLSPIILGELRRSLVHFYAIPNYDIEGFGVAISSDQIEDTKDAEFERIFDNMKRKVVIIKPRIVLDWIVEGVLLMLRNMVQIINEAKVDETQKWNHVLGIDRIYRKMMRESAIRMPAY